MSSNWKQVNNRLEDVAGRIAQELYETIYKRSIDLQRYVKTDMLTGGTSPNKLASRTGKLRASVRAIKPKIAANGVRGGISFGTRYAITHVGKKGTKFTIKPKNSKFLKIPLDAAKTSTGRTRKDKTLESRYDNTFVKRSNAGNLIIFGTKKNGNLQPLFTLKKKVKVPRRVFPEVMVKWVRDKIEKDLDNVYAY